MMVKLGTTSSCGKDIRIESLVPGRCWYREVEDHEAGGGPRLLHWTTRPAGGMVKGIQIHIVPRDTIQFKNDGFGPATQSKGLSLLRPSMSIQNE